MTQQLVISVYGSHNAAVSMYYKGKYYVVEVERWTGFKNAGLCFYLNSKNFQQVFDDICEWLLSFTDGEEVDVFLVGYADPIRPRFKYKKKISYDHHTAHAATAFYQSEYDDMLVFTFDGGGDGAFFNVYLADRENGISLQSAYKYDLGFPYMVLADTLEDIKRDPLPIGNLVYAGKLMGLCAYGNVREEWLPHFVEFYKSFYYDGDSYRGGAEVMQAAMEKLFAAIKLPYKYKETRFTGQDAWDIAATTQRAFETQFFDIAQKYLDKYPNKPVGLAGGCALNVLLNTKLAIMRNGKVFIPPNTNDCGMAVGGLLWYLKPKEQVDLTYSGLPILDESLLHTYINDYGFGMYDNVSTLELAAYISEGKIVGLIQGNSEHGSRALGNRSIICSPVEGMKDTINLKVKNREWYRPFAPVVRLQDVNKYFDFRYESRHMTYAAKVREEYVGVIPAVTHQDGTGRLQTVTSEQNPLLYEIITNFETITGNGVLLNTSFNVNGKPILTTLRDAFFLLNETKLDAVFFKNRLIVKGRNDSTFDSLRASGTLSVQPKRAGQTVPDVLLVNLGADITSILKQVDKAKSMGHRVSVMCMSEVGDLLINENPTVRVHKITPDKFYHKERLLSVGASTVQHYLKLIWIRELLMQMPPSDLTLIIETNNIGGVNKKMDEVMNSMDADSLPKRVGGTNTGLGLICGLNDDLIRICHGAEKSLLTALNSDTKPTADHEQVGILIEEYNKNYKN